ncbi:tyrosine-protein phosphatase [Nesterenkonia suensis]
MPESLTAEASPPERDRACFGGAPFARLPVSRLQNLRDLARLPVAGGVVREGILWRADDVALAASEQLAELAAAGLRTVVDLRSVEESRHTGPGLAADHGIRCHHVPLTQEVAAPEAMAAVMEQTRRPEGVGRWYACLVDDRAAELVETLRIIAGSAGGVVVHCAAGKDRTGVAVAAVLAALGAPADVVVADYARSDSRVPAVLARLRAAGHVAARVEQMRAVDGEHAMLRAPAASMEAMLRQLDGVAGLRRRLEAAGMDPELQERLRDRLVRGA